MGWSYQTFYLSLKIFVHYYFYKACTSSKFDIISLVGKTLAIDSSTPTYLSLIVLSIVLFINLQP